MPSHEAVLIIFPENQSVEGVWWGVSPHHTPSFSLVLRLMFYDAIVLPEVQFCLHYFLKEDTIRKGFIKKAQSFP